MIENLPPLRPEVRVLIVDDSMVVREILKQMLESDPGIRVVGMAANGGEAVELTAQLKPDLVTMDLVMPGMGGMEATERIMAHHPTPVLFFSSYFNQEGKFRDALAAYQKVVTDYPKGDTVATAWYKIGQTYENLQQPDLARKAYETVIKTYATNVEIATLAQNRLDALNRKR